MRRIYKYHVPEGRDFSLMMPEGAKFLKLDIQNARPVMWWIVDPEGPMSAKIFTTRGTGHALREYETTESYLGSYLTLKDQYVGHVFEVKE